MTQNKVKRTWFYLEPPSHFDIAPCKCSNKNTQWSEYEKHLWCDKCEVDFIPEHNGIFDSPVPMNTSRLLGLSFSIFNMKDDLVEILDSDNVHTKCLNAKLCIERNEIILALKNLTFEVIGSGKLNLNDFTLSEVILKDDSKFVWETEVCFDYPDTKHFSLLVRKDKYLYILADNQDLKRLKSYILNETLINKLDDKNDLLNKKNKI